MKFLDFERPELSDDHLRIALESIIQSVQKRIDKHGRGMVVSDHEALGVLEEEYHELTDAVTANDRDAIIEEWLDVAVTCIITVASVVAGAEQKARKELEQQKVDESLVDKTLS
jgi:NTP pyrophosphatase (non-canonical NTP hydrolase)